MKDWSCLQLSWENYTGLVCTQLWGFNNLKTFQLTDILDFVFSGPGFSLNAVTLLVAGSTSRIPNLEVSVMNKQKQ